jgi:hypothetical protein
MTEQTSIVTILAIGCVILVIMLIVTNIGLYFYFKQKKQINRLQTERDAFKKILSETGQLDAHNLKDLIASLERKKIQTSREFDGLVAQNNKKKDELNQDIENLNKQIVMRRNDLIILDDEILLQSFGFYKPQYDLVNSQAYKFKLDQIRAQQAKIVKEGNAASGSTSWTLNNDRKEGERMVKDYVKLILRSFNNECDASITNVKFNNINDFAAKTAP